MKRKTSFEIKDTGPTPFKATWEKVIQALEGKAFYGEAVEHHSQLSDKFSRLWPKFQKGYFPQRFIIHGPDSFCQVYERKTEEGKLIFLASIHANTMQRHYSEVGWIVTFNFADIYDAITQVYRQEHIDALGSF